MQIQKLRPNNFDLLRILAALQVAVMHGAHHLQVPLPVWLSKFLDLFPGVPIFFVISGFLISASYEKIQDVRTYSLNRALRIFPALWVCLAVSIATAIFFGGINFLQWKVVPWIFAQLSFLQFYNPDFLRSYGTGVLNGSLWTIAVELEFYVLLPMLYFLFRSLKSKIIPWILLFILFLSIAIFISQLTLTHDQYYLMEVTLFPHLYMFLMGIIFQRLKSYQSNLISDKGVLWLSAYLLFCYFVPEFDLKVFISRILLAFTTVSLAYTKPALSQKILRDQDISYGTYIYHMVFVNIFVALSLTGRSEFLFAMIALTLLISAASWIWVEKPALKRKRETIRTGF